MTLKKLINDIEDLEKNIKNTEKTLLTVKLIMNLNLKMVGFIQLQKNLLLLLV